MEFLWKLFCRLAGPAFQVVGLYGSIAPISSDEGAMNTVISLIANPTVYIPSVILGTIFTTIVYGSMWAEHRLTVAGGLTRREFPARYKNWDRVQEFTVWQISWLWVNLEPQASAEPTEGTPAYPTFRWLKGELDNGKIYGATRVDGSWVWATFSRQELIDFALDVNARPKFLFPQERFPWPIPLIKKWLRVEASASDISSYKSFDSFERDLRIYLENEGSDQSKVLSDQLRDIIIHWLKHRQYQAIGRRKVNGYKYYYLYIAPWKWEFFEVKWDRCTRGKEEYFDVMIKQAVPNARTSDS